MLVFAVFWTARFVAAVARDISAARSRRADQETSADPRAVPMAWVVR